MKAPSKKRKPKLEIQASVESVSVKGVKVVVIPPDDQTDYQQFSTYARQNGCQCLGVVGCLPDNEGVKLEKWTYPNRRGEPAGSFMVTVDKKGRIGVYEFVGQHGDPLVKDIQWLHRKVNP
jgi:hypothetical protein